MKSSVIVERSGRVTIIEMNRPEVSNAVDMDLRKTLGRLLDEAARDPDCGAVVLAGAGRHFCSGGDLKAAARNPDSSVRRTARTLLHDMQPLIECITRMEKPVIAAVNGAAAGVGMSLALACDFMVMAEDAYLMSSFVNMGLIPDAGGSWFLVRRLGYGRALEVMMEAQKLSAERCLDLGVSNRTVPVEQLRSEATEWAARLASRAPLSLALTKRLARLALTNGLSEAMTIEAEMQTFLASSGDAREAIAAFAEKRPPRFEGH